MSATITARGAIPTPKPLPKPPRLKLVADWKPAVWDAEYRLEAYHDTNLKAWRPGFAVAHSCGLSLVHPSDDGELGGDDNDIRQNWLVKHTASGLGFGLRLNFKRAASALSLGGIASAGGRSWWRSTPADLDFSRDGLTVTLRRSAESRR
jgi:hypothetical protein